MKLSFEGKSVIVTGATRGIGKEIALAFVEAGAKLTIFSRKQDSLEKVKKEIEGKGGKCLTVCGNMDNLNDISNLVNFAMGEYGKIDILVNNAATNPIFGPIINAEEKAWDKIMGVNLKGPFFLSNEVIKTMLTHRSGNIINIVSTAGISPMMGLGVYCISKAGLIMLTKVLAKECAQNGIRVNAVSPGLIKTQFSQALWSNEEILKQATLLNPLKRIGEPNEIAGAVLFLASDYASYINGEIIVIDGGAIS